MNSVPSMRMSAASNALSQWEHTGATRASSSFTSELKDIGRSEHLGKRMPQLGGVMPGWTLLVGEIAKHDLRA